MSDAAATRAVRPFVRQPIRAIGILAQLGEERTCANRVCEPRARAPRPNEARSAAGWLIGAATGRRLELGESALLLCVNRIERTDRTPAQSLSIAASPAGGC